MERCFSCAEIGKCTELYARKPFDYRGPYFPIFERFNPPSSSNSISPEGTVKVCELCHIFLLSQWQNYERQGVTEARRIYFTKRHDSAMYSNSEQHYLTSNNEVSYGNKSAYSLTKNGDQRSDSINSSTKTPLTVTGNIQNKVAMMDSQCDKSDIAYDCSNVDSNNKQLTEHHICCFVCGLPCLKWHAKTAYSSQVLENKEYFPFFEKLDPPQLSIGLTNGATKICIQCESDLQKQWEHYESLGTDQMLRTYHITNEHNNSFSITNPGRFITNSMMNNPLFSVIKMKNSTIKCALCPNKVIDPYTVSWSQRASCLFIANLKNFPFPSEGCMVDKHSEEAIICDVCHYFLSYQMQAYNTNMTPLHLREYKLPKVGTLSPSSGDKQTASNSNIANTVNNINNTNNRKPVTLGSSLSAFSAPEGWQQSSSQLKRSKTPTLKTQSKTPVQFTENNRQNSTSKPSVGNHDQSSVLGPIIANCHICLYELRDPNNLKTLPSAVNEETPDQAYFPFLKTLRLNSMKNYEFPVCVHCYYNLHGQWRMFHKAAVPIYERKYNHNEFMCTQCQHLFAQKTDIVIVRDRLLCVSCLENRGPDVTKNSVNVVNQDADATSHNSLLSMKTKTTVTVTPISNELSGPNLTSLNYADTMKQLNTTKLFDSTVTSKPISTGTPVPLGNSVNQFNDISRHSSLPSDIYQNSKNLFSKSMKRPAVAAVAPNQRQNTPHLSSDPMSAHSDMRIKIPDMPNFHGNLFNQNPAFNSLNYGSNANINNHGNSNYSLPMFPANSAFALHSPHAPPIGRKSSKCDRDNFLPLHTANNNFPAQYFDSKSRLLNNNNNNATNNPVAPSASNPFINWTQPSQHHHQSDTPNHGFPPMQPLSSSNPFEQSMSANNVNSKEAEMTMLLYMMYQKQMQMASEQSNKFPGNNWFGNPSMEEMSLNYYQTMMAQQNLNPAMLPTEDLLNSNNNIQSYMMNTVMANYQYNQMLQMISAYQQSSAPSINSKMPSNVPGWFNQFNMSDQISKRPRPETMMFDQQSHMKPSLTPNGFSDLMKYSELLKSSSMGTEYEKFHGNKYPSMHINTSSHAASIDSRTMHNHKAMDPADLLKMSKQFRDEYSGSEMKPSPKETAPVINNVDTKVRKSMKSGLESGVLDLSQTKQSHKSPYAIDSLTELGKSCDIDSQDLDLSCQSTTSLLDGHKPKRLKDTVSFMSGMDFEQPLKMHKDCHDRSQQQSDVTSASSSQLSQHRLISLLESINTPSLVGVLKNSQTQLKEPETSELLIQKFNKCPTALKFHKFLNHISRMFVCSDIVTSTPQTRCKSSFMKQLGLQRTPSRTTRADNLAAIDSYVMSQLKKTPNQSQTSVNGRYWTKWILKNLQLRLSMKVKPHVRRSLMRPVLSGDIEVRFCTAKHKHELENLRNIIKILIKYT